MPLLFETLQTPFRLFSSDPLHVALFLLFQAQLPAVRYAQHATRVVPALQRLHVLLQVQHGQPPHEEAAESTLHLEVHGPAAAHHVCGAPRLHRLLCW